MLFTRAIDALPYRIRTWVQSIKALFTNAGEKLGQLMYSYSHDSSVFLFLVALSCIIQDIYDVDVWDHILVAIIALRGRDNRKEGGGIDENAGFVAGPHGMRFVP